MDSEVAAIIIFTVLTFILVAGVAGWLFWSRLQSSWHGIVIDKAKKNVQFNKSENSGVNNQKANTNQVQFHLLVKTHEGKQILHKVSSGVYEMFAIGDAIAKQSGTFVPHKPEMAD